MSLLLVDMTAAMNILSDQAGDNLFCVLDTRMSNKSIKRKPVPMLPIQSIPRRKPIVTEMRPLSIPNPDLAKEDLNENSNLPLYSSTASYHDESIIRESHSNEMPLSPADSPLTRSSSVYSTDSVSSTDSIETTISGIVAMYTDLINKISWDELPSDVQLLQPQAYRDTVAPLMERRFSDDAKIDMFTPPISPVPALRTSKIASGTSSKSFQPNGLGIRNLSHCHSAEGVEYDSPVSPETSSISNQSSLNAISEPSPIVSPIRPFSWGKDETEASLQSVVNEARYYNPSTPSTQSQRSSKSQETNGNSLHQLPDSYQSNLEKSLRYVRSPDMFDMRSESQQKIPISRHPSPAQRETTSAPYRSTPSIPTSVFAVRSGSGETAKATVKEKVNRRREEKEMADILATAALKYPGMQQDPERPSRAQRRPSFKDGVDTLVRRLSMTGPTDQTSSSPPPPRRQRTPAIPLTPYQKYGADIWLANNKKLKKNSKDIEARKSEEIFLRPQPDHASGHRRTASARPYDPTQSPGSQRKSNFMSAWEGAKHSLTNNSAEKRREKLKGSIVVVGPVNLNTANVYSDGGRH